MTKEYTYKQQGDGSDSWLCVEMENGIELGRYMVYENPNIKPIPSVDVLGLLQSLSESEINQIKVLLS